MDKLLKNEELHNSEKLRYNNFLVPKRSILDCSEVPTKVGVHGVVGLYKMLKNKNATSP